MIKSIISIVISATIVVFCLQYSFGEHYVCAGQQIDTHWEPHHALEPVNDPPYPTAYSFVFNFAKQTGDDTDHVISTMNCNQYSMQISCFLRENEYKDNDFERHLFIGNGSGAISYSFFWRNLNKSSSFTGICNRRLFWYF